MRFKLSALAVFSLFAQTAFGFEPFTIKNIRIEGAERTEAGTIYNYLPVHTGEKIDELRAQQAVTALFATGFFNDVRLEIDGEDLIVIVSERPVIGKLTFIGIKDIPEEELRKSLKTVGLAEARVFDRSTLDAAVQELKQQYYSRGKYSAEVTTKISPVDKGRVEVVIEAAEGLVAKIDNINIIGSKAFSEEKLLGKLDLGRSKWWKPFSTADKYSKVRLQGDEETLKSLYQNNGYIEFDLKPSLVSISPDKKKIYISMSLSEGEQYSVSDIKFAGDSLLSEEEMRSLIPITNGDIFSKSKVTASINKLVERLGDDGYAFANINAIPELDSANRKISFTFVIDMGRRVYINRINVVGNTVTRDEIVRRELRQMESAKYSSGKIKRSKERLDLLGFFSDVSINTSPVQGSPDQVDLNVNVVEKQTGNIQLGMGFSQGQGVVLSGAISQNNIFGTGNRLDLKLNGSKVNRVYSLSYVNPYWTTDGVSRSFDIYKRYVDPTSVDLGAYTTESIGTRVRFGVPITETNSIFYGFGYEEQKMQLYDNSPQKYFDFVDTFGDKYSTVLTTMGWSADGRDSFLAPTSGIYQNISLEAGLPLADIRYYKLNYQYQWFYPLSSIFTFMANGELGFARGYSGNELPFYLNFFGGGVQSVRGYKSGSLGPRDTSNNSLGGDRRVNGNLELFFPLPNMEEDKSVRASVFVDGGWVYGAADKLDLGRLRYSMGSALSWASPVGPLKISVAYPLNKQDQDKTEFFQFSIGGGF